MSAGNHLVQDNKFYMGHAHGRKVFAISIQTINKFAYLYKDAPYEYLKLINPKDFEPYKLANEVIVHNLFSKRLKIYGNSFHITNQNNSIT